MRPARTAVWLLPVAAQNLILYWRHYLGSVGIPWDFLLSYYGMVAFWTGLVREGVWPEWVPFQQMGYPFALQIQSGMHYPPFWIFAVTDLVYTLHAAIVTQCLHMLAGAIGMFLLARLLQRSDGEALVAAVTFQCFGGFFSNAEHPDIIRAFVWSPWLLWACTLDPTRADGRLPARAAAIPPLLYLFLTGAYPGNIIAGGLIIPLYVLLQLGEARRRAVPASTILRAGAGTLVLGLLGVAMAIRHLGPIAIFRDQYFRGAPHGFPRETLWLEHLPGLFMSNASLPGEISMTSTYVSLPILILAGFAPVAALRRLWVFLTVGVVAAVMAAGDHLPIGAALRAAVPVFGLSRFPSSDYRVFIAIPAILLGLSGLHALRSRALGPTSLAIRSACILTVVGWGVAHTPRLTGGDAVMTFAMAMASITFAAVVRHGFFPPAAVWPTVLLLVVCDASRVVPRIPGWSDPNGVPPYGQRASLTQARNRARQIGSPAINGRFPASRPARVKPDGLDRWLGYLNRQYYANDLTPNVLRVTTVIESNQRYQQYMMAAWTPVLVPAPGAGQGLVDDSTLDAALAGKSMADAGSVTLLQYGINEIRYGVMLRDPVLMVENEMYFPGWRAGFSTSASPIEAIAVNGVFRGWRLPPGTYTMVASFEFPNRRFLTGIAISSTMLWLVFVALRSRGHAVPSSDRTGTAES